MSTRYAITQRDPDSDLASRNNRFTENRLQRVRKLRRKHAFSATQFSACIPTRH
jgi:hypothetical protein